MYITTQVMHDQMNNYEALFFVLDTRIPVKVNANIIYTEFDVFCQSLQKDISNISENELR